MFGFYALPVKLHSVDELETDPVTTTINTEESDPRSAQVVTASVV